MYQSIVALGNTFYIFGGLKSEEESHDKIVAFDTKTKEWNNVGELKHARSGHGVIIQTNAFVVVGGMSDEKTLTNLNTERCTIKGNSIVCSVVDPELYEYVFFPELIHVPQDYCPK